MEFEFDFGKSQSNLEKHGIDFVVAQSLWADEELVEIQARVVDEPRSLVVGRISGAFWSAVITQRSGRIRLISVRRSRAEEVALYESQRL